MKGKTYRQNINNLLCLLVFIFCLSNVDSAQVVLADEDYDIKCGTRCLLVIFDLLGIEADLDGIRSLVGRDETMYDLYQAIRDKGFETVGVKTSIRQLENEFEKDRKLAIALVEREGGNHYLIVENFVADNIRIIDPPHPPFLIKKSDFQEIFTGNALLISKKRSKQRKDAPDIHFEETVYDFGKRAYNETILHVFTFKNLGEAPLRLKIKASCKCIVTIPSKQEFQPEEEGRIRVSFSTEYQKKVIDQNVFVYSNDPDEPVVILTITGIVEPSLTAVPSRIYFGEVSGRKPVRREIRIINLNKSDTDREMLRRIKKIETSSDLIEAIPGPTSKPKEVVIDVKILAGIKIGDFRECIVIYTDDETKPKIEIPVEGRIAGEIIISPQRFFFGILNKAESRTQRIEISKVGEGYLKIISVKIASEFVSARVIPIQEGSKYIIEAVLSEDTHLGAIRDMVKIYTNSLNQPIINIPLYAFISD